jgi:hypothetical protein
MGANRKMPAPRQKYVKTRLQIGTIAAEPLMDRTLIILTVTSSNRTCRAEYPWSRVAKP